MDMSISMRKESFVVEGREFFEDNLVQMATKRCPICEKGHLADLECEDCKDSKKRILLFIKDLKKVFEKHKAGIEAGEKGLVFWAEDGKFFTEGHREGYTRVRINQEGMEEIEKRAWSGLVSFVEVK